MRHYTLIVGHYFSLSNETDRDVMTDYFPGIWTIKTKKSALRFSKDILAKGDTITVCDYDNPKYHKLANGMIKELGLKQELFKEPEELVSNVTDSNVPSNLGQLKKYLTVDKKLHIAGYNSDGEIRAERDTFVKKTQSNAVVLDKQGANSWLYFEKASNWKFDNDGATQCDINRDGKQIPYIRITFIKD